MPKLIVSKAHRIAAASAQILAPIYNPEKVRGQELSKRNSVVSA